MSPPPSTGLYVVPPPFELYRELDEQDYHEVVELRQTLLHDFYTALDASNLPAHTLRPLVPESVTRGILSLKDDAGVTPERFKRVIILSQKNAPRNYIYNLNVGTATSLGNALLGALFSKEDDQSITVTPSAEHISLSGNRLTFGLSFQEDILLMSAFRRTQSVLKARIASTILDTKPHLVLGVLGVSANAPPNIKGLIERVYNEHKSAYASISLQIGPMKAAGEIFDEARKKESPLSTR